MTSEYYSYFYNSGFFGFGEKGNFKNFSFAHIVPLVIVIGIIVLLCKFGDKIKNWKHEENLRFTIAFVMLFVEMSYFWRLLYVGPGSDTLHTMLTKLPLQICQWSLILTSMMMLKKSKALYPISYFICLSCGVIACIIPNTVISTTGPAYYRYYQFWLEHALPIISVFYMMKVHDFKVSYKEIYKPCVFLFVLGIPCVIADTLIPEANFLYLRFKIGGALGRIIPENIYLRIPIFFVLIIVIMSLTYLPILISKKKKEKSIKISE